MIPRTLKIRGHVYKVKQVDAKNLGDDIADVDYEKCILRLYKRALPSRKVELILHEAVHVILAGYEVENEEALVTILGEGITGLIRDNPGFIKHALKTLGQ